jgi:hypothetical protein
MSKQEFVEKVNEIYKENYESAKRVERHKILNKLKEKLKDIQKAKAWSVGLSYPYPEAHAIWMGKHYQW